MVHIPFDTLMEIQSVGKLPAQPLAVAIEEDQVHARGAGLLRGPFVVFLMEVRLTEIAQEECY